MNLTLEADYAVRIVIFLARQDKKTDAGTISDKTGVSLRFALKILRKLMNDGIVCSFKGVNGGYLLLKKPEDISLREVISSVSGEYVMSRCIKGMECTNPCNGKDISCKMQQVFIEITDMVNQKLQQTKISDLI